MLARSTSIVPSLAGERRWPAPLSHWLRCENRDGRMRAGRASRLTVEYHRLSRVCSDRNATVDINGTPPPSCESARRLSPGWHSCRQPAERQLLQPPSLREKRERGDEPRRAA
jgi:hypothetical protein